MDNYFFISDLHPNRSQLVEEYEKLNSEIDKRNWIQLNGDIHPFTCGNNRSDEAHVAYAKSHNHGDYGILEAVVDGWKCPVCNWKQDLLLKVISR